MTSFTLRAAPSVHSPTAVRLASDGEGAAGLTFSFDRSSAAMRFVSRTCATRSPPWSRAIFSRTLRTSSTAVTSCSGGVVSGIVVLHDEQVGRDDLRGREVQACADD